jgi:hypothetical protein
MIRELQEKMIELGTQDLMVAGMDAEPAAKVARNEVVRTADLFQRALIATGTHVTYDKPRNGVAEADKANMAAPSLKFPTTPDRPRYVSESSLSNPDRVLVVGPAGSPAEEMLEYANTIKAADRAGKSYDFPEHLKVGGSLFNEGNPADTCCGPDEEGPVAPSDEELAWRPAGQDAEDKLGIIAAVVDSQPAFGSDLARFLRRLKLILDL